MLRGALASWARELSGLSDETAGVLAPWLSQLSAAIGPPRRPTDTRSGEPDGFSGIGRRGTYERLLAEQWLLADVHDLEFLRRAVEGELSFYALQRVEPGAGRRTLVLFDAGPDQLGAPRLAHLALWMVFARRAAAAKAELVWGTLQSPGEAMPTVGPPAIRALLAARTLAFARPQDLEAWNDWARTDKSITERWVVGGDDAVEPARRARLPSVRIGETWEPSWSTLSVEVSRGGGRASGTVTLELPPPEAATRLIRAPFEQRPSSTPYKRGPDDGPNPSGPLAFVGGGTRLLCESEDGRVIAYHVPGSPHETPGRYRAYRKVDPSERIVAAGIVGRKLVVLTVPESRATLVRGVGTTDDSVPGEAYAGQDLTVVSAGSRCILRRALRRGGDVAFEPALTGEDLAAWSAVITRPRAERTWGILRRLRPPNSSGLHLAFHDADGGLWDLSWFKSDGSNALIARIDREVLAVRPDDPNLFVRRSERGVVLSQPGPGFESAWFALHEAGGFAWYGSPGPTISRSVWPWGTFALRLDEDTVRVWHGPTSVVDIPAPFDDERIVGVVERGGAPLLLHLSPDRHELLLQGPGTDKAPIMLRRFDHLIARATLSAHPQRVAVLTADGGLWVLAGHDGQVVLSMKGGER